MSGRRGLLLIEGGLAPAGAGSWPEIVVGAVRPEFQVEVYFPERGETILFGSVCAVDGCPCRGETRPKPERLLCHGHTEYWRAAGRPDLDGWLASGVRLIAPGGVRPSSPCAAEGCRRSRCTWCRSHAARWYRAGRPSIETFAAVAGPVRCGDGECEAAGCGFPTMPGNRLCDAHHLTVLSTQRYRKGVAVGVDEFVRELVEAERRRVPHYDFSALPEPLRSEFRFAIQQRLDENQHSLIYTEVGSAARWAAGMGVESLIDHDDRWWASAREQRWGAGKTGLSELSFVRYARARLSWLQARALGADPFAGDVWVIDQLGIPGFEYQRLRSLSFVGFEPEWFRELVKRWTRWRLQSGSMTPGSAASTVSQIKKFCDFLHAHGEHLDRPESLTRGLLERYRAHIAACGYSPTYRNSVLVSLRVMLDEVRFNGWEPRIASNATYFRGELPRLPGSLPRCIDEFVMGQIEAPENIARIADLTIQTAFSILIKTGLRTVDVCLLPFDPIVHDAAGAPVLRYYNHKLKREAARPVDDLLVVAIRAQQHAVSVRFPNGCRWLLPSSRGNPSGDATLTVSTLRKRIRAWLEAAEVRDAHGRPVKITPHQFRHTLATRMINEEIPLVAISRLLDHSSMAMTEVYARLSDASLRREFEKFNQRVNIRGEVIPIDPAGLINEAAWMKERLARAKQTLANGYCGLPLQQSCPHPNACLTCGHFLTTEQFLPVHREQLAETEALIAQARAEGSERKLEMNETVRLNLVRIIEGLESIADQGPDGAGDEQRDAS